MWKMQGRGGKRAKEEETERDKDRDRDREIYYNLDCLYIMIQDPMK
jgi:hypothetical protein